jgi:CHAT domain-containing protein
MKRKRCILRLLFKVSQKSLLLVFSGLILTAGSVVATPSLVKQHQILATTQANANVKAQQLRQQGLQLLQEGSEESLRKAILIFEQARNLSLSVNDMPLESYDSGQLRLIYELEVYDSLQLGLIYERLKDKQQASKYFNQVLTVSMRKELRNALPSLSRLSEATARVRLGKVYADIPGQEQQALDFYQQALTILRDKEIIKELNNPMFEVTLLYDIGMIYSRLGKRQQALEYFYQSLSDGKVSIPIERATIFTEICDVLKTNEYQRSLDLCNDALMISRKESVRKEFPERSQFIEARVLKTIGDIYSDRNEIQKALEAYEQALLGFQNKIVRDKLIVESIAGEALLYGLIGQSYTQSNNYQKAWASYNKALTISRNKTLRENSPMESLRIEALILGFMGSLKRSEGNYQQAVDLLEAARVRLTEKEYLKAFPSESRRVIATIYSNIGLVYEEVGQLDQSAKHYEAALSFLKGSILQNSDPLLNRLDEATTLYNLAALYVKICFTEKSSEQIVSCYKKQVIDRVNNTLEISREQRIRQELTRRSLGLEVRSLNLMASTFNRSAEYQKALKVADLTLPLARKLNEMDAIATTLHEKGRAHFQLREDISALESYIEMLSLIRKTSGFKDMEATAHQNISTLYQRQGNLLGALTEINAAVEIVEDVRQNFRNSDFKTSYFASVQDIYADKIDLLMQLHKQQPQQNYDRQALETSDRARARGLIELLTESRADIRKGIHKDLLDREKDVQQKLDAAEKRFTQLARNSSAQAEVVKVKKEIESLNQSQNQLKDDIRRESPAYAQLKYPEPLKFTEIQQQLDPDTVLLQYSLSKERSYLWVVSKTGINSYILPGENEIESEADRFYSAISSPGSPSDVQEPGQSLSKLIKLDEVMPQLQGKKLLIAADGTLHRIPFAALPNPNSPSAYTPLILEHEIVNLPSISAVATLRRTPNQFLAPKTLAVVADPVFTGNDPRVNAKERPNPCADIPFLATKPSPENTLTLELQASTLKRATRDMGLDMSNISPLPNTRREAERILAMIPKDQRTAVCDFDANRDWVTQQAPLNQYRYLLFATHGLINTVRPEESSIVLSLVDQKGQPRSGLLRLGDIFNLNLNAELVVLSACQTGRAKEVKGEGLIGLTRGLMYAGAKRVVVTLWNVNDSKTADLMETFYQQMIRDNRSPPIALQLAQKQMWQTHKGTEFQHPYYWAAFTLQGEWRP